MVAAVKAKTMSHEQVDAAIRTLIEEELKKGAKLEDFRIVWNDVEWRWSPVMRRWDIWNTRVGEDQ